MTDCYEYVLRKPAEILMVQPHPSVCRLAVVRAQGWNCRNCQSYEQLRCRHPPKIPVLSSHWVVKGPERKSNKKKERKKRWRQRARGSQSRRSNAIGMQGRKRRSANDAEKKPGHERESVEKRQWHGILYWKMASWPWWGLSESMWCDDVFPPPSKELRWWCSQDWWKTAHLNRTLKGSNECGGRMLQGQDTRRVLEEAPTVCGYLGGHSVEIFHLVTP